MINTGLRPSSCVLPHLKIYRLSAKFSAEKGYKKGGVVYSTKAAVDEGACMLYTYYYIVCIYFHASLVLRMKDLSTLVKPRLDNPGSNQMRR